MKPNGISNRCAVKKLMATPSFTMARLAADYEMAMAQRRNHAKADFMLREHLSAEPRGNEVDLRKLRTRR